MASVNSSISVLTLCDLDKRFILIKSDHFKRNSLSKKKLQESILDPGRFDRSRIIQGYIAKFTLIPVPFTF